MGGCQFVTSAAGSSPAEAFKAAVEEAEYEHGHGGYTGTIAEKSQFTMFHPSAEWLADMISERREYDHKYWKEVEDKWGPAGCFALGDSRYMFFGWASE